MVKWILLSNTLSEPLKYHWRTNMFEVCPDCVRAHEHRLCNGETEIEFKLCHYHGGSANHPRAYYDKAALAEVRRVIHLIHSPVLFSMADHEDAVKAHQIIPPTINYPADPNAEKGCPVIMYEHVAGCAQSPQPHTVVIPPAAVQLMEEAAQKRLDDLAEQIKAEPDSYDNDLRYLEQARLCHCLAASQATKCTYTKRCNGEYRSDLDDIVTIDPEATDGVVPSEHGFAVLDVDGIYGDDNTVFDSHGFALPVPFSFTYRNLKSLIELTEQRQITRHQLIIHCWLRIRNAKKAAEEANRVPDEGSDWEAEDSLLT